MWDTEIDSMESQLFINILQLNSMQSRFHDEFGDLFYISNAYKNVRIKFHFRF